MNVSRLALSALFSCLLGLDVSPGPGHQGGGKAHVPASSLESLHLPVAIQGLSGRLAREHRVCRPHITPGGGSAWVTVHQSYLVGGDCSKPVHLYLTGWLQLEPPNLLLLAFLQRLKGPC